MNNHNTHTIRNFPSQKKSVLGRNKDGMVIAVRLQNTVAWGEDPRQQEQRSFVDVPSATAFLRKVADADQKVIEQVEAGDKSIDLNSVCARIEEVDADSRIYSGVQ